MKIYGVTLVHSDKFFDERGSKTFVFSSKEDRDKKAYILYDATFKGYHFEDGVDAKGTIPLSFEEIILFAELDSHGSLEIKGDDQYSQIEFFEQDVKEAKNTLSQERAMKPIGIAA